MWANNQANCLLDYGLHAICKISALERAIADWYPSWYKKVVVTMRQYKEGLIVVVRKIKTEVKTYKILG